MAAASAFVRTKLTCRLRSALGRLRFVELQRHLGPTGALQWLRRSEPRSAPAEVGGESNGPHNHADGREPMSAPNW